MLEIQTQAHSDWMNENIAPNFKRRELLCFCCQKEGIKDELVFHLQMAHDLLPAHSVMIITSGYRCEEHNKEVGGVEDSAHLEGLAADVKCEDPRYRFLLIAALIKVGFKRIGIYDSFVHCDLAKTKDQKVMW